MTSNVKARRFWAVLAFTVLVGLASGLVFAQSNSSDQLTTVTLRLNWKVTGPHAAYFLGKELGFYRDEGIDLQIKEGNGSGNTALLVGNKSNTFGLADAAAVTPLVAKGLPITAVAMVSPRTSLAVVARKDSGITTLQDLEGKRLAVTAGDALTQIWPAVVAKNNLDGSKIKLVYVDASAKVPLVLNGQADALLGSSSDQNFTLEAKGVPAVTLDFADYGVNVLNLAIYAHNDLIKQNPDLIRRFVKATQESFAALPDHMDLAVKLITAAKPELDPTVARNQAVAYAKQLKSPNCPDAALLYNCPADWDQTINIMSKYEGLKIDAPATSFYTNDFVQ